jgi:hypothetical protein
MRTQHLHVFIFALFFFLSVEGMWGGQPQIFKWRGGEATIDTFVNDRARIHQTHLTLLAFGLLA